MAVSPDRPYTKEELHTYVAATRRTCRASLLALTEERAQQTVKYPRAKGKSAAYLELQLYNMRHVQEHAAQRNLFLGQQAIPVPNTASRAKDEPGSR